MSTPMGEPLLVEINGYLLNFQESVPGKISITFDDLAENLRHEVVGHELQKINYKTVEASVKGHHPNILKATLVKNPDELFVLTITVSYEFLPEIQEQIIFGKREIQAEESEQIAVRNMRNSLRNLKDQILVMSNIQVQSGQIQPTNGVSQVYLKLFHENTLVTWSINLRKPDSSTLRAHAFYMNSVNKVRSETDLLPKQGMFCYHSNDEYNTDLRFVVAKNEKYDTLVLQLESKCKGHYDVSLEKVIIA